MTLRKTLAIIGVVLLFTALASAAVYADKPVDGAHNHGGGEDGGNGGVDTVNILVFNFGYSPPSADATGGKTARWTVDGGKHTVTSVAKDAITGERIFDSGALKKGKTFSLSGLNGTFKYFCTIHGFNRMNGEIVF